MQTGAASARGRAPHGWRAPRPIWRPQRAAPAQAWPERCQSASSHKVLTLAAPGLLLYACTLKGPRTRTLRVLHAQCWHEARPAPAGGDLAQQTVTSAGGERFHAFAKATTPGRDVYLYEDAVAPFYGNGAAHADRPLCGPWGRHACLVCYHRSVPCSCQCFYAMHMQWHKGSGRAKLSSWGGRYTHACSACRARSAVCIASTPSYACRGMQGGRCRPGRAGWGRCCRTARPAMRSAFLVTWQRRC